MNGPTLGLLTNMKYLILPFACVVLFASTDLAQQTNAKTRCVLEVSASESIAGKDPADPSESIADKNLADPLVVPTASSPLTTFTATATNLASKRVYDCVLSSGHVRFEDIPEGMYKLTVRSASFKTSEQIHSLNCAYTENGIDPVDVLMERGSPSEVVSRKTIVVTTTRNPDKLTVAGDGDRQTQAPPPSRKGVPKIVSGGVLNGKAKVLPKPVYPPAAYSAKASGSVVVQVLVDETGKVVSASAVSGHPLLQPAAVAAARQAEFSPTLLNGVPVKVSGVLTYNFVP